MKYIISSLTLLIAPFTFALTINEGDSYSFEFNPEDFKFISTLGPGSSILEVAFIFPDFTANADFTLYRFAGVDDSTPFDSYEIEKGSSFAGVAPPLTINSPYDTNYLWDDLEGKITITSTLGNLAIEEIRIGAITNSADYYSVVIPETKHFGLFLVIALTFVTASKRKGLTSRR